MRKIWKNIQKRQEKSRQAAIRNWPAISNSKDPVRVGGPGGELGLFDCGDASHMRGHVRFFYQNKNKYWNLTRKGKKGSEG